MKSAVAGFYARPVHQREAKYHPGVH